MKSERVIIKVFRRIVIIGIVLCVFVSPVSALDVRREVLPNGLILLVYERHNLPVVQVSVGIDAGSIHEPREKAGLANLVATLLTHGTSKRTAEEISEEIEFVGGRLSASGGRDYVSVNLSVLKKDVKLGFDLLSDVILNPVFPEDEITKEKELIKGSLKSQNEDPVFIASREFKKALFGTHPYGRLVTGTAETIERISRDDLIDFHRRFYLPGNAIMAVVGDITYDEVRDLIDRYFKEWKGRGQTAPLLQDLKSLKGIRVIEIDKDLTQATVIIGHLGVKRSNPDYYAISVMNYILGGGGFASRLMQNIREERGLVYDIYSLFSADKYGGYFRVVFQTKNESANLAIREVFKEIKRIRTEFVTDKELSDAKAFLIGSFPMRIETSARIASFLVAVEYYGLGIEYMKDYKKFIEGVTREDVMRVAKRYLDPENILLVVVGNQKKIDLKEFSVARGKH